MIYYEADDIVVIRLSDEPIVREVSQEWHTHISYDRQGDIVEIVILEGQSRGLLPIDIQYQSSTSQSHEAVHSALTEDSHL